MTDGSLAHRALDALRFRRSLAMLAAASALAVAVPVAVGLPNLYRSSATLLVDGLPIAFQQVTGMWELERRLQAIKQEALSRERLTELIERFDLYPELRRGGMLDAVIALVQKDVRVEITSTSQGVGGGASTVAFAVSYVAGDPHVAAGVANELAAFYIKKNDAMRSQQATRTAAFLKATLDSTRRRLDAQEQRFLDFVTKNTDVLPEQMQSTVAKYGQLMQQVQANTALQATVISQRDGYQNQIAALTTPRAGADAGDPAARLAQSRKDLDALLLKYGPAMPEVKNKQLEIQQLEEAVAARRSNGAERTSETSQLETLRAQLANANRRLDELKQANDEIQETLTRYDAIISGAHVKDVEFDRISRELAASRAEYDSLQKQYQTAVLAASAEQESARAEFRVLDPALPPVGPAAPNRMILLAFGVFGALALGIGLVLLLDRMDSSFRSVEDLRAYTHVPVLVTIPRIVTRGDRVRGRLVRLSLAVGAAAFLWWFSLTAFDVAGRLEGVTRILLRLG